jgi:phage anti-repressor protein
MFLHDVKKRYNKKQIELLKKYGFYESSNYVDINLNHAYDKMYNARFDNGDYFLFIELDKQR